MVSLKDYSRNLISGSKTPIEWIRFESLEFDIYPVDGTVLPPMITQPITTISHRMLRRENKRHTWKIDVTVRSIDHILSVGKLQHSSHCSDNTDHYEQVIISLGNYQQIVLLGAIMTEFGILENNILSLVIEFNEAVCLEKENGHGRLQQQWQC